jgi:hypothetical protein
MPSAQQMETFGTSTGYIRGRPKTADGVSPFRICLVHFCAAVFKESDSATAPTNVARCSIFFSGIYYMDLLLMEWRPCLLSLDLPLAPQAI